MKVVKEQVRLMNITRVNIKNYKSMENSGDIIVDSHIFALIGQNNTGKSTVLDAIQCLFPDAKKNVEYRDFYDRTKDVVIELEFTQVKADYITERFLGEECKKHQIKIIEMIKNNARPIVAQLSRQKFRIFIMN